MHRLLYYVVVATGLLAATCIGGSEAATFTLDPNALGRRFDGVGGLSGGGATSRLLVSYPESVLSQILDLLFKPNYVASLHMLKVEIGGDAQSTDGTESSHMHFESETPNFNRGYEWWLMKEAKARNPNIKLYGLPWAFPGWVGDIADNNPYVNVSRTANYVAKWVRGAKDVHGLHIDYVGIWNERSYTIDYIEALRSTLDAYGLQDTMIVAHDSTWDIVPDILDNPTFASTIDVIGVHYPGTHSTSGAVETGKQLWASEDMSTYNDLRGAECWARILNQNYVNGNMTSTTSWNLIASYYHGLKWYGTGLMTATEPWSGAFDDKNIGMLWASAHTTHFTQPGWRYLAIGNGASVLSSGGSLVSLTDGLGNLTIVVEKMAWAHSQCIRPPINEYSTEEETVDITLTGAFAHIKSLAVYTTQYAWDGMVQGNSSYFVRGTNVSVTNGKFSINVPVDALITLTTLPTESTGSFPASPPSAEFPVPYKDDFDSYPDNQEASYFADQAGVWEILPADDRSRGKIMRQMVPMHPISWSGDYAPYTVFGDVRWTDVTFSLDVMVESPGGIAFIGARTRDCCTPNGLYVAIDTTSSIGRYVVATDFKTATTPGSTPASPGWIGGGMADVYTGKWATLKLVVKGNKATGYLGPYPLFSDATVPVSSGWVTFGTGQRSETEFVNAQFDNFVLESASILECPTPKAGVPFSVQWCGSPNEAANQWDMDWDAGSIALKSNSSLCMGLDMKVADPKPVVTLKECNSTDPTQKATKTDSHDYPYSQISLGGRPLVWNTVVDSPVYGSPATSAIASCGSSSNSKLTLTPTGTIESADGLCLDGTCSDANGGCPEAAFVPCSEQSSQRWHHQPDGSFTNAANNMCLDLWAFVGPNVGVYKCNSGTNQQWQVNAASQEIQPKDKPQECLSVSTPSGTNTVVDEFGNGELTPYGPYVTDMCISACSFGYVPPSASV